MPETATITAADLKARLDLQPGEQLYAVVDAARDPELAFEAREHHGLKMYSLFKGDLADAMADVAPYLVPFEPDHPWLESWAAHWGNHAGIFIITTAAPLMLWKHLREIFVVQDEDGQEYFFRFYDPRVLMPFADACHASEREEFFGPVLRICCFASHDTASHTAIMTNDARTHAVAG
jgi:hypothetical protein